MVIDKDNVEKLPDGITSRKCPGCSYLMNQIQIELSRYNFKCPGCGKFKLNDFIPEHDPEPPKSRKKKIA